MPPPPPPYGYFTWAISLDGKVCVNGFHYQPDPIPDAATYDIEGLGAMWITIYLALLLQLLGPEAHMLESRVKVTLLEDVLESGGDLSGPVGLAGGHALPNECVACVRKHFAAGVARIRRGHYFLSGVSDVLFPENYLTTPGANKFKDLNDALKTPFTHDGVMWTPAVYSPTLNSFFAITRFSTDTELASLRRRRPQRSLA